MALISTVQKARLTSSLRLDAEHYSPRFLPLLTTLQKTRRISLRKALIERVKTGHTPSTKVPAYYAPGTVKFIKTDNLREDRVETADIQMLSEAGNAKIRRSELRANDVIVTIIGATEEIIGRAARVVEDLGRGNINQNIALIRSTLPSGYLATFLNTKYGREQLIWLSRQTGQVNLNCREVEEISIPIHTEGFVSAIHNLNSKRHSQLSESARLYAEAHQALLTELGLSEWKPSHILTFVNKFRKTVEGRRLDAEYFQPRYPEVFEKLRPTIGLDKLGKLVSLTKGIEVGGSAYTNSGVPFWRVSNLSKFGLETSNVNYVTPELYEALRDQFEPHQGEILLSKDATPGLAYFLEERHDGIISGGILRLSLIDDVQPHYLELVLNSILVQLQIEQSAGGSVIKHWKPSEVAGTLIPRLSPREKEVEIAALVRGSHAARKTGAALLQKAKHAIEAAIEEGEERGMALCSDDDYGA